MSRMRPPARLIGVDVGGTKVAAALASDGRIGELVVSATDTSSSGALVEQLAGAIERLGPADAVGVAIPGAVERATGASRCSTNVPLTDVPLRLLLAERLGLPVFVDNDATCAALAEAHSQPGGLPETLVMVTLGTGLGSGVVVHGRPLRGAMGAAGELGHLLMPSDRGAERLCSLESLAAGPGLAACAAREGLASAEVAVRRAEEGDMAGLAALDAYARNVGMVLAIAIAAYDPDVLVIGGGVSAAGETLRAPAERHARALLVPGVGRATRIRLARHGSEAGVRGAARMAADELERAIGPRADGVTLT